MSSTTSPVRREAWDPRQQILKFCRDDEQDAFDDRTLTLWPAYDKFELPDQHLNSVGNRNKFRTVLRNWEAFWGQQMTHERADREPTIGEITKEHLRQFRDWLKGRLKPKTVNVYCGYIKQILRKCGPPDSRNPDGHDVLSRVPYVRAIPAPKSRPEIVWLEQLGPWYEACRSATWPSSHGIPAPLWWRCLLVLCFTYGFRTTDVVQLNNSDEASRKKGSRPQGMDWSALWQQPQCPIPSIPLSHALGWFYLRPGKTEKHKAELVLPLTAVVKKHLDALPRPRSTSGGRRLVLPAPVCCSQFTEQNMKIQQSAGFELRTDSRGRRQAMTPQMLRRSCKSYWSRLSPEVSSYIGGWSPRSVDDKFYLQPLTALLEPDDRGERLIDRFRYPEAFLQGP
jgi:hypothetical protein